MISRAALCALLPLFAPSPSLAAPDPPPPASAPPSRHPSLKERTGPEAAELELKSGDPDRRRRALSRLGSMRGARAIGLLSRAHEPGGAAQTPEERLIAVRALANHVGATAAREALVRLLTGIGVAEERAAPLQGLLRDTAALALAASDAPDAMAALARALHQTGRVAEAAAAALLAHPPSDLAALVRAHGAPSAAFARLLGALGDQRAFSVLRDMIRQGPLEVRAEAAIGLTRLGDFETVALARHWLERRREPGLRLAALEILALAHEPLPERALAELLEDPETHARARELLFSTRTDELVPLLLRELATGDGVERALAALGRIGSERALAALVEHCRDPVRGDAAAYALAQSPGASAAERLGALLADRTLARRALRAALLRFSATGATAPGVEAALARLSASADAADRAAAAFGTALLEPARVAELLASPDAAIVRAAARAAPFVNAAGEAALQLARARPGPTRTQLALALADARARALVPTSTLLALIEEAGPAAPLAWFALAERDSPLLRARLLRALAAPRSSYRAHVALGLGRSAFGSALGVLAEAYAEEADGDVRLAIVQALARRPEAVRRRPLALAARLDPDARVRNAARLALAGTRPATFSPGSGTLWLALTAQAGPAAPKAEPAATLRVPGGLGLPIVADPDGVVTLGGLPKGPVSLELALVAEGDNAPGPTP